MAGRVVTSIPAASTTRRLPISVSIDAMPPDTRVTHRDRTDQVMARSRVVLRPGE